MSPNLAGRICLVTGGSKGIGRGIALQLGAAGAKVYVTGRNKEALESCCNEIKKRGGEGVPMIVDHSKDEDIEGLFDHINKKEQGKLDVLVNNAYAGVNIIMENREKKFWEAPPAEMWDTINNVGLRNHYICTTYAARMMVPRKSGLIVIVSSGGGLRYLFNVPYGVGKAACDRLAADCAFELRKEGVSVVSLWPGPVQTETVMEKVINNKDAPESSRNAFKLGETLEFSGKAVAHLAADPNAVKKSGRVLLSADLAREYGFTEEDGTIRGDMRSVKFGLRYSGWTTLASFIPEFLRIPHFILYYAGYKF